MFKDLNIKHLFKLNIILIGFFFIISNASAQTNDSLILRGNNIYKLLSSENKSKYIFNQSFCYASNNLKIPNELKSISLQRSTYTLNPINYKRLGIISGITLGSVALLHYYQMNAWWKDQRRSFHFQNDWEYALWIDKLGHFWGAYAIQHLFSSSLNWANIDYTKSIWYGSILATLYQFYVEFEDGFAGDWGFSPGDALFDFLGATYPLAQYYFPTLKNFNLKYSYYPSKQFREGIRTGKNMKTIIDDYEGQSFYLSVRVNNLLPEKLEKFWPDFLCLAIGYNMRNWNGYGVADKNFYLALDYDTEQIPIYGDFAQFIKNTLNLIHFPAPGIKYSNKKFYLTIAY